MMRYKTKTCTQCAGDPNRRLTLGEALHLLICSPCRQHYREMRLLVQRLAQEAPYTAHHAADDIMRAVPEHHYACIPQAVSDLAWLVCGVLLLFGGILLPFTGGYGWAQLMVGAHYGIITSILFGLLITVYAVLFVLSHYRLLQKIMLNESNTGRNRL